MTEITAIDVQDARSRTALRTHIARVKSAGPGGAPVAPTLKDQRTDDLAQKVAEARASTETTTIIPDAMTDQEARQVVRSRFDGHDRTPTGLLTDTRLRAAENATITNEALVRKFGKDGYDSLTPAQQTEIRDRIDRGLDRLPGMKDLPARGTPERQAAVEAWLRDPVNKDFRAEVLTQAEVAIKGDETGEESEAAKVEISDAETQRTVILQKIGEVQEFKEQVDRDLERFDVRAPGSPDPSKGEIISDLDSQIANAQAVFEATGTKIQVAQKRIEALALARQAVHADRKMSSADKQAELDRISNQEQALQVELTGAGGYAEQQASAHAAVEAAKARRDPFVAERAKMQQRQDGLAAEWDNLLKEFNANGTRLDMAYAAQFEASGDVTLLPDKVLASVEQAFVAVIQKRMNQDATTFEEELQKAESEAKDETTRALARGVRRTYFIPTRARGIQGIMHGHESSKINKQALGNSWGVFLTDRALRTAVAGGPDAPTGAEAIVEQVLLASGMNPAEVANKLGDPEFMKQATPFVMSELIRLRTRTGSKISENEREYLATFEWSEDAWQSALQKSAEGQKMLDEAKAQGLIEGKTFGDLRRADKATILKILLAVFGSAALAAGALGVGGVVAVGAGGASIAKSISI